MKLLLERIMAREALGSAGLDSGSFGKAQQHCLNRASVGQRCPVCPALLVPFAFACTEVPLLCGECWDSNMQ